LNVKASISLMMGICQEMQENKAAALSYCGTSLAKARHGELVSNCAEVCVQAAFKQLVVQPESLIVPCQNGRQVSVIVLLFIGASIPFT
jgi:hypothetical protein